jgi:hypothetical protein
MTPGEEVAIRWLVQHVATLSCGHCGGRWLVPKSGPGVLFHNCHQPRQPGIRSFDREGDTQEWARSVLGDSLAESVERRDGAEALLRQLDS